MRLRGLVVRVRALFSRASTERELDEELRYHMDREIERLVAAGVAPDRARLEARRLIGNTSIYKEEVRDAWGSRWVEQTVQDLTYAFRGLRRQPTLTVGVTLTLALGIGANAAMFSLVDRLLFRPPALMIDPASANRVYLYRTREGHEDERSGQYPRYADLARWSTTVSQTAAFGLRSLAVGEGDATRLSDVAVVSAGFFGFFKAPPVIGRYFTPAEDAPPAPARVAVLSRGFWQSEFGSRRDVLGATVRIDAIAYTIIGIAPDDFVGLWPYRPPVAWIPVATYVASRGRRTWATNYDQAFGLGTLVRRKPGVTPAAATADLTLALRRSYQMQIDGDPREPPLNVLRPRALVASVLADRGPAASSVSRTATWLSGVTLIVLLIACANVANLLLARAIRRRREIAVRIALGVSRRRLIGQLLTEGMLLAILGGLAGVLIAVWGSGVVSRTFLPGAAPAALLADPRTLTFVVALALGVGLLIGMAPIAQSWGSNLAGDLKSGVREGTRQRGGLRTALLLSQTALSVVLLVGAALFVQSLRNVRAVPLGFDADSTLVVDVRMRGVRLDTATSAALRARLLDAAKEAPGVSHASPQISVPFAGMNSWPLYVTGIDSTDRLGEFDLNVVSPEYFATMGTRILRGRGFQAGDVNGAQRAAVIGKSMAAVLWPGRDPLGQCLRVEADSMPCTTVVGVAEDIHSQTFDAEPKLFYYYLPTAQFRPDQGGLFVRARGDAGRLVEPLRRRLQREMPGASFVTVRRMSDIVDDTMRSWIVGARVFTVFGLLALVLAAVGLYSVIAYNVTQRRHELGVRLALGAQRTGIVRLVVSESVRVALAGIAIGGAVSLIGGRWIAPLLFHQSPRDPAVFAFVILALVAVATIASWLPALRAAGLDPKSALEAD